MIPFIDLGAQFAELEDSIRRRMDAVLEHGRFVMGPEVTELERALEAYTGAPHCITTSSGTDALLIALMALGVGPGDEVITTPFTFVATAEVIVLLGARPVFADVEADSCNLDPERIAPLITERTRAILPVSLYGQVADMDRIAAIAEAHGGLPVIEDAAQSFGARYRGRRSCNLSRLACTSFFPSKPLGCYGDGGAVFTDDAELAAACREIRVHGQAERYVHTRLGLCGRLDTLQAAVLLAKLEVFEAEVEARGRIGARYHALFAEALAAGNGAGLCTLPPPPADQTSVHAQYTVRVEGRDRVRARLDTAGIPTAVHYPRPVNEQPAYREFCCPDCTPVASELAREVLSLPMHPRLAPELQATIVNEVVAATARDQ